jgi:prefoldin subunit 5
MNAKETAQLKRLQENLASAQAEIKTLKAENLKLSKANEAVRKILK